MCRRAEDPAHVADRDIILADVDAVAAGQPGEVRAVVHDQRDARLGRDDPDFAGAAEPFAVRHALLAVLDHIGTAGKRFFHDPRHVAERRQAADQDHQPGIAQHPMRRDGGHRQLLDGVNVVRRTSNRPASQTSTSLLYSSSDRRASAIRLKFAARTAQRVLADLRIAS